MSKFPIALFTLTVCILVAASPALRAYWVTDGVAICTATGHQHYLYAVSDGAGGAIVAWSDYRGGTSDIYVQRVTASGVPLWTANGVAICTAANNQVSCSIVSDGAGGAIIAWMDGRTADDLYAQRVNSSGVPQWTANGVAICTATGVQSTPLMVPDGGGGAIVVWQDNRVGGDDVYAQRVNALGTALWTANGIAICTAAGSQYWYKLTTDGAGGAIVTWSDSRSGASFDIYAQRVNLYGAIQWTTNGVALCTLASMQGSSVIAPDMAGGAFVAWADQRGGSANVYIQRVNASGTPQWTADGIAVYGTANGQGVPVVISDGAGGVIVGWEEMRGTYNIYAQRLNASGVAQWSPTGVVLSEGLAAIGDLYGTPDGLGGAIFSWSDHIGGFEDIFARRLTGDGALPWGSTPATVSAALDDQVNPSIAPDGAGGAVIVFRDSRSGTYDIYAQLVDPLGRLGWLAPDIESVRDVPGDQGGRVFLSWDAARADRYMDATMSYYSIWRSINQTEAARAVERGASEIGSLAELEVSSAGRDAVIRVEEREALTIYWQLVDTHDALNMEGYGMPVATLFDSSAYAGQPHYFQVVAHTTDPHVFWKSEAVSGWSVDNLPPEAPAGFVGEQSYEPIGLQLSWDQNAEGDLSHYALYRGTTAGFVPGPENILGELDDAGYFDGEWSWNNGYFYKLAALDIHGNVSGYALLSPDGVTGVETPKAPEATYLAQNYPNPFNPTTRIAFGLSAPGNVSLKIYDAAGRLVRVLIEGARPAGTYAEMWDGRDGRGVGVASGIYFYRLTAGAFTETRKMALLR